MVLGCHLEQFKINREHCFDEWVQMGYPTLCCLHLLPEIPVILYQPH